MSFKRHAVQLGSLVFGIWLLAMSVHPDATPSISAVLGALAGIMLLIFTLATNER